ncbi:hypothetical protein [Kaistella jeonii]|nr:hypothetical protein [Kaistella jeonii]SFC39299.1 hypothetical protein SAMN05421876_1182 [Kaistella jeonii]VEI95506.1 Uncharacterised protein [Kaistella jeonii]
MADNSAFHSRFFAYVDLLIIKNLSQAKRAPFKSGCKVGVK